MRSDNEIKEILEKTFMSPSYNQGTVKLFKSTYPDIVGYLKEKYGEEHKAAEMSYCYLHGMNTVPRCRCGGRLRFKGFMHGYSGYCSERCRYLDKEAQARAKEKRTQTNMEKFGVENVFCRDDYQDKARQTRLDKYGDMYYSNHEKARETCMHRYGSSTPGGSPEIQKRIKSTFISKYGAPSSFGSNEVRKKIRKTMLKRYGVEFTGQSEELKAKQQKTTLERYGFPCALKNPGIRAKARKTIEGRYGVSSYSQTREFHTDRRHKFFSTQDPDASFDSTWEVMVYDYCLSRGVRPVVSPCILPYESGGKKHYYVPDFMINGHLVETKGNQFLGADRDSWTMPYRKKEWTDEEFRSIQECCRAKSRCAKEHGVIVISQHEMNDLASALDPILGDTVTCNAAPAELNLHGLTEEDIFELCKSSEFPGMMKWPKDHPIWRCHIDGRKSPFEAWTVDTLLHRAVTNMLGLGVKSRAIGKEPKYSIFLETACKEASEGYPLRLLRMVLDRFTKIKIAPKVTAFPKGMLLKTLKETGVDISTGVYCPMAGFGGLVEGSRQWLTEHGIDPVGRIYSADINEDLCRWYGWEHKDVLSDTVETDKTVLVCPPFDSKEQWPGTPESMYKSFEEWTTLIRRHVKAPKYMFFGPPTDEDKHGPDLFLQHVQARYYPEYSAPL